MKPPPENLDLLALAGLFLAVFVATVLLGRMILHL